MNAVHDSPGSSFATTLERLALEQRDRDQPWQPTLWSAADPDTGHAIADLLGRGEVVAVHDQLDSQLRELARSRDPRRSLDVEAAVAALLDGIPRAQYGTWVHYPWLRRLVRALPKAEFREVRTSRNRNKITAAEQARLSSLDLAIIGLSVGRATAVTLALEGIGGHLRLADFDELSLSNMNRLRAGIHEIGLNKAVLTARTLFEIDPYLEVSIWPGGLGSAELDAFLTTGRRVDILFEECDDLEMKIRAREAARRHRVPVLMETSDRGMLDVERFDLEPDRPLFHGLAGELDPDALRGLDTYEKVPTVAKIIGLSTLSRRMAASLIDVDATLATWPQLASAVALGGALNTDAARRIALGGLRKSGRYHVDLETIVNDDPVFEPSEIRDEAASESGLGPQPAPLPRLESGSGPATHDELLALVAWATRAPSGGNSQPWRFAIDQGALTCRVDPKRARTVLDDGLLAAFLACGAAAEHVALAAPQLGLVARITELPDPAQPDIAWRANFSREPALIEDLAAEIERRCSNRKRGPRVPLASADADALRQAAADRAATLQLVDDDEGIATIAQAIAQAERQRLLCARLHRDMFDEIRWTERETESTRDGLDVRTLELNPTERAGMTLLSSWEVMATVRSVGGGQGLERPTREALEAASAVGLLTIAGDGVRAYLEGGRALARVWLRSSALGLAFQPMSAVLFLLQHIARTGGSALDPESVRVFSETDRTLDTIFGPQTDQTRILLFRLARAAPPSARSLRRRVADSLDAS